MEDQGAGRDLSVKCIRHRPRGGQAWRGNLLYVCVMLSTGDCGSWQQVWMPGVNTQRRTQDMNVDPPFCISQSSLLR